MRVFSEERGPTEDERYSSLKAWLNKFRPGYLIVQQNDVDAFETVDEKVQTSLEVTDLKISLRKSKIQK